MMVVSADLTDPEVTYHDGDYYLAASGEQLDLTHPIEILADAALFHVHGSHIRTSMSIGLGMWIACNARVKVAFPDGRMYRVEWGNYRDVGEPETPSIF
jgi:hypothetical protein